MKDSPPLPPQADLSRAAKTRIILAASRYWHAHPLLQDEVSLERWSRYCLDRVLRGMPPLDTSIRETIDLSEFQ